MSIIKSVLPTIRRYAKPTLGKLGLLQWGTRSHVIEITSPGTYDGAVGIVADLHLCGDDPAKAEELERIKATWEKLLPPGIPISYVNLWDILTMWTKKHRWTRVNDIANYAGFLAGLKWTNNSTVSVLGNHETFFSDRANVPSPEDTLEYHLWVLRELWHDFSIFPEKVTHILWQNIQTITLPCFNRESEKFTPDYVRNIIEQINRDENSDKVTFVVVHNPDAIHRIEQMKKELGITINNPTIFVSGHVHGLMGFPDVSFVGDTLSHLARKWIDMSPGCPYIRGLYRNTTGEPYIIYVSQGMGNQPDLFRLKTK